MRRLLWVPAIGGMLLSLAACSGAASVVRELAKDPATVCVVESSIYVELTFYRSNLQNGKVSCSRDGMTIETTTPRPVIPR